jgi:putative ABC transport system permease protein
MFRRIVQSFLLAVHNMRSSFFHTLLSVLGIVIGVGALVSILSLIDGMEKYAKEQIASTTSVNMISINSDAYKRVENITIRKDSVTFLQYTDFVALQAALSRPASSYLFQRVARELSLDGDTVKAAAHTTGVVGLKADSVLAGRTLTDEDLELNNQVCVLTESIAKTLSQKSDIRSVIGRKLIAGDDSLTIVGVIDLKHARGPEVFFPFSLITTASLQQNLPQGVIEAENVEDVPILKEDISTFLAKHYTAKHDFKIATNEFRVSQAAKGFQLFRIIMGLIVGISVVVGGVGVMNVLLISVTERTAEIGIRKAMGANRRDIILLFLAESITISSFGSFLGVIFGVLFTMIAIPIVKALTEIPFQAAYTLNTFLVISGIAILVGISFGTYPAIRASRLNPVDAIRHE